MKIATLLLACLLAGGCAFQRQPNRPQNLTHNGEVIPFPDVDTAIYKAQPVRCLTWPFPEDEGKWDLSELRADKTSR